MPVTASMTRPGDTEAGVVVAPRAAGRRDLHQVRHHRRDEIPQRVFAALGTRDLAFPSAVWVSRFQTVTSRLTVSSRTLKSGRYVRTGALRSTLPCSTSRIIAVAANVFEIDAIGKTVCGGDGKRLFDVGHAEPRARDHAVVEDADGDARDTVTRASSLRPAPRSPRTSRSAGLALTPARRTGRPTAMGGVS